MTFAGLFCKMQSAESENLLVQVAISYLVIVLTSLVRANPRVQEIKKVVMCSYLQDLI